MGYFLANMIYLITRCSISNNLIGRDEIIICFKSLWKHSFISVNLQDFFTFKLIHFSLS